jgi:single-stranded DNA-binding protein
MNPITVTVTGTLGDEPRTFARPDNTTGVELRLALDLPPRGPDNREVVRWVKVKAYGTLAACTARSLHRGDRVTVTADDFYADAWADKGNGQPRGRVVLHACEIAASLRYDDLTTGRATRASARADAANGQPSELPAGEQADLRVLGGVLA